MIEIHKTLSKILDFLFFFVKRLFKFETEDDRFRVMLIIAFLLTVLQCFGISHYDPRIPILVMLVPAMFGGLLFSIILIAAFITCKDVLNTFIGFTNNTVAEYKEARDD